MDKIAPRDYSTDGFQTKEIKELGLKVDELIKVVNKLITSYGKPL